MRVAVIGHVEWVEFASVDHVPEPGGIAHATSEFQVPAGGGAVAAVQLRRLAGAARFYTALGDDELGHRSVEELERLGVRVETVFRSAPQRRGLTLVDAAGERTITTLGEKHAPRGRDPLDWGWLRDADAVFFVAGDADALRLARAGSVVVATSRVLDVLVEAALSLDAVIGSGKDDAERYRPGSIQPPPDVVVTTEGRNGGTFEMAGGRRGSWPAVPPPGPMADTYGLGDSFAAGVTYGLGARMALEDALELGARCGAVCATGHGPYEEQLTLAES